MPKYSKRWVVIMLVCCNYDLIESLGSNVNDLGHFWTFVDLLEVLSLLGSSCWANVIKPFCGTKIVHYSLSSTPWVAKHSN